MKIANSIAHKFSKQLRRIEFHRENNTKVQEARVGLRTIKNNLEAGRSDLNMSAPGLREQLSTMELWNCGTEELRNCWTVGAATSGRMSNDVCSEVQPSFVMLGWVFTWVFQWVSSHTKWDVKVFPVSLFLTKWCWMRIPVGKGDKIAVRFQNGSNKVAIELRVLQVWFKVILVKVRSFDFEITRKISDQNALHSVQLSFWITC